nr:reverse transcriptase domain-containing protein [Tanacetum cinerariifolium]
MQTQTSNALHNAIMETGGKDHLPMLASESTIQVQWTEKTIPVAEGIDSDIYFTVDACPNACEMWKAIERLRQGESINVQDLETNLYWEFGKFTSRDGESLKSYYSREKAIVNSSAPIYDQAPNTVTEDDKMSKENEIDKLVALISLSFKKIYKPTNNNLRTSSNTSKTNQDNSPRIKRGTWYENHRVVNVVGDRETVEQADWKDDTDDESDDQELEAHYMYTSQIQEGIDFMGSFPSSKGNEYILVAVYYLSKWVEAKALPTNDARVVVKFLKSLFSRFDTPRANISDRGTHFCNHQFTRVMIKYGVTHRLATAYHPQTSGQVEERLKKLHDSKIKNCIFNVSDQVLLFNSRLKIFFGKLKTRWSGPFTITRVFPYGTIELSQPDGLNFKVNGHRVKHYFGGDIPSNVTLDLHTFLKDN